MQEFHKDLASSNMKDSFSHSHLVIKLAGLPSLDELEVYKIYIIEKGVAGFSYSKDAQMNVWSLNPLKDNEEETPQVYFADKLEFGSKLHLWVGKYCLKKFFDPLHFQEHP